MTKLYEAPDYELLVLNSYDVVTASGDNWSMSPTTRTTRAKTAA